MVEIEMTRVCFDSYARMRLSKFFDVFSFSFSFLFFLPVEFDVYLVSHWQSFRSSEFVEVYLKRGTWSGGIFGPRRM